MEGREMLVLLSYEENTHYLFRNVFGVFLLTVSNDCHFSICSRKQFVPMMMHIALI